jgi:hypothetical protein
LISSRRRALACSGSPAARVSREPVGYGGERLRIEALGRVGELVSERLLLLAQVVELRLEPGDTSLELAGLEISCLERLVVAVERTLATANLLDGGAALFFECGSVGALLGVGAVQGVGDQVGVAIQAGELVEDGGFELVAVQPFTVAGLAAELLPPRAGVAVVDAAVPFRAHADVGAPTTAAANHPGQEELGSVAAPQREVVACGVRKPGSPRNRLY